jgi:hypothetical protein
MGVNTVLGAIDLPDVFIGDDLRRDALGVDTPGVNQKKAVAILRRQVEVVDGGQDGEIIFRAEPPDEVENLHLPADI